LIGTVAPTATTTTVTTGATAISQRNPETVKRVVGYTEYGAALARFDRLLEIVTPGELEAIEKLVQGRDELAVYSNLSRRLEQKPGILSERSERSGDNYERRGLKWMMALARVELGAILAAFTENQDPFQMVRPSKYELPEYTEILEDSMRAHYWALRNDPVVKNLRSGLTSDTQAIAYARRVAVAIEFIRAVRTLRGQEYSVNQRNELDKWQLELTELERSILYDVLGIHPSQTHSVTSSDPNKKSVIDRACQCINQELTADLQRGQARLTPIPDPQAGNLDAGARPSQTPPQAAKSPSAMPPSSPPAGKTAPQVNKK
jgi:hypothetical protein